MSDLLSNNLRCIFCNCIFLMYVVICFQVLEVSTLPRFQYYYRRSSACIAVATFANSGRPHYSGLRSPVSRTMKVCTSRADRVVWQKDDNSLSIRPIRFYIAGRPHFTSYQSCLRPRQKPKARSFEKFATPTSICACVQIR